MLSSICVVHKLVTVTSLLKIGARSGLVFFFFNLDACSIYIGQLININESSSS